MFSVSSECKHTLPTRSFVHFIVLLQLLTVLVCVLSFVTTHGGSTGMTLTDPPGFQHLVLTVRLSLSTRRLHAPYHALSKWTAANKSTAVLATSGSDPILSRPSPPSSENGRFWHRFFVELFFLIFFFLFFFFFFAPEPIFVGALGFGI